MERNVVRTEQNTPESLGRVVLEKGTEGRNRFRRVDQKEAAKAQF